MIDLIGQPRSQIFKIKNIFIQFNRYTSVHNVQKNTMLEKATEWIGNGTW